MLYKKKWVNTVKFYRNFVLYKYDTFPFKCMVNGNENNWIDEPLLYFVISNYCLHLKRKRKSKVTATSVEFYLVYAGICFILFVVDVFFFFLFGWPFYLHLCFDFHLFDLDFRTKGTPLLLSVWPIALVIDSLACAIFMRILFGVSIILAIDIISIAHSNGNKFKHSI